MPNETDSPEFDYKKNVEEINRLTKGINNVYYIESIERYTGAIKDSHLKLFKDFEGKFIMAGGYIGRCLTTSIHGLNKAAKKARFDIRYDMCQAKPFEVDDYLSVKEKKKLFIKTL